MTHLRLPAFDDKTQTGARLRSLGLLLGAALLLTSAACAGAPPREDPPPVPQRIISLVPSVTETLFALGAGDRVVGVSTFDTYPAEVAERARVGGLIDPNTERILALQPDLAFLYDSQEDLIRQLTAADIAIATYRHGGLDEVIASIRNVGERVGETAKAERLARSIQTSLQAVRGRAATGPRPTTLIVFGREEGTLRSIYASGGTGFIHDMVEAAGGRNIFADIPRESVQASLESILERAPEVILEIRGAMEGRPADYAGRAVAAWSAAPTVPAVRHGRVHVLLDERLVVPGPRVIGGIKLIADALRR